MTYTTDLVAIIDEDDMISNTDAAVPTQQSVKAYVDAHTGNVSDSTFITKTDESVTLPNSQALSALATGIMASTITTGVVATRILTGTGNQIDIASGDGSANPTFTLSSTMVLPGNLTFVSGGATTDITLDEDDMASNDPNALATQQSIKAYVDTKTAAIVSNGGGFKQPIVNRYYTPYTAAGDGASFTASADNVYFAVFYLHSVQYTRIGIQVNTGSGGADSVRLGVYTVGTDGLPDTLSFAGTTVSVTTNGEKEATIAYTPPSSGWYYLAAQIQTSFTMKRYDNVRGMFRGLGSATSLLQEASYMNSARAYGDGLETTYTGSPTYVQVDYVPSMFIRIV